MIFKSSVYYGLYIGIYVVEIRDAQDLKKIEIMLLEKKIILKILF
jgi:hypothetical protein